MAAWLKAPSNGWIISAIAETVINSSVRPMAPLSSSADRANRAIIIALTLAIIPIADSHAGAVAMRLMTKRDFLR